VVRTAVAGVSDNVREGTFEANADIIEDTVWVATLDANTCTLCAALDGQRWPVGQGKRAPAHWGCRCSRVPVIKSWTKLGLKGLKDLPEGTRASMNGQVPDTVTYGEWLKDQDQSVQEAVLGVKKAGLFRSGKLKINDFVDDRSRILTLAELGKLPL
jgi:hypothetical protein